MPRQRKWSRGSVRTLNAVFGSSDLPSPDHSFIVGKELGFSGDHLFREQLAQSEQVLLATAEGNTPKGAIVKIL